MPVSPFCSTHSVFWNILEALIASTAPHCSWLTLPLTHLLTWLVMIWESWGAFCNISVNPGAAIWSIWLVAVFKMGVLVRHLCPCCEPDSSIQGQPKTPIQHSFIRINISNLIIILEHFVFLSTEIF